MQFSPYKKPFEERIIQWYSQLKLISDILEEWGKCQGNWMYLQVLKKISFYTYFSVIDHSYSIDITI